MLHDPNMHAAVIMPMGFNGHPPLGVNATGKAPSRVEPRNCRAFQWAPTLGGECYETLRDIGDDTHAFQWAPTLGGECYAWIKL